MKAVKVCHMTSTHLPKDQRIFHKECTSLAKAGYKVFLVEQGGSCTENGVKIVGTGEAKKGRFYRLIIRPFFVYRLAKAIDADIYHFHDMELMPYGNLLKKHGKKVIFDYHEDYASRFADSDALHGPRVLKKLIAKIYAAYEKKSVKRYDAMISVTPHVCKRLARSNKNTIMVTNYPLLDVGNWIADSEYNEKSDYISFAGQISETYSVETIVDVIQDIPDIRLKMCGPFRRDEYREKIKTLDINNKTDYLGNLDYTEVPAFLKSSRLSMVIPGYSSNLGGKIGSLGVNKLFEAMLCGVPAICTDFVLWKEICERYKCALYVNPYDKLAIITAINKILDNPSLARKMGKNGQKAVRKHYNWNTQEVKLIRLYKQLETRIR